MEDTRLNSCIFVEYMDIPCPFPLECDNPVLLIILDQVSIQ